MIDWNRKLEAVHADGRVLTLDRRDTTKLNDLQWWVSIEGTNILVVGDSGFTGIGWTIRNVVPPTHTYTVRPEDEAGLLASDPLSRSTPDERAVALVKRMAKTGGGTMSADYAEARAIVAALEPVDPDEAEVTKLLQMDDTTRNIVRLAIKRGRALASRDVTPCTREQFEEDCRS